MYIERTDKVNVGTFSVQSAQTRQPRVPFFVVDNLDFQNLRFFVTLTSQKRSLCEEGSQVTSFT